MPEAILVADDEPGVRESLAEVLRDAGYAVQSAPDGTTALVALEQSPKGGPPSVALTCFAMPVESSYSIVSRTPFPRVCTVTAPRGDMAVTVR